jgi:hypothetical protein
MNRILARLTALVFALLVFGPPAVAQDVLTVRVESLDAFFADTDTLMTAVGQEAGMGEMALGMLQGMVGVPNFSWVERDRPIVLTLPLQGAMLGQKGLVLAFPVADEAGAISALRKASEGASVDEDGVLHMPQGGADSEEELLAYARGGYILMGQNANILGGFDPKPAIAGTNLPPGSIALDFNVDSMRAMIGMLTQGLRPQLASAFSGGLTGDDEDGDETLEISAENAAKMADSVSTAIDALVANTAHLQLSIEFRGDDIIVHNNYIPTTGSTLERFLGAQKKTALPKLIEQVDSSDAAMITVISFDWTEDALAAVDQFMTAYGEMLSASGVMGGVGENPISGVLTQMLSQSMEQIECFGGDIVQAMSFVDGLSMVQLQSVLPTEECRGVGIKMVKAMTEMTIALTDDEGKPLIDFKPESGRYKGVEYMRSSMDLGVIEQLSGEEDEESVEMMNKMFGDGVETFIAQADNLIITVGGTDAKARFEAQVDRHQGDRVGKIAKRISPGDFAPFGPSAGIFMSMDMSGFANLMPEGSEEAEGITELFEALGPIRGAVEFQRDAVAAGFALSLNGIAAFVEASTALAAEEVPEEETDE